jgi:asparagine N-glycosylation enzyme membrane subunit Stt3
LEGCNEELKKSLIWNGAYYTWGCYLVYALLYSVNDNNLIKLTQCVVTCKSSIALLLLCIIVPTSVLFYLLEDVIVYFVGQIPLLKCRLVA